MREQHGVRAVQRERVAQSKGTASRDEYLSDVRPWRCRWRSCTCEADDQSSPGQMGGSLPKHGSAVHSAGAVQRVDAHTRRSLAFEMAEQSRCYPGRSGIVQQQLSAGKACGRNGPRKSLTV